MPSTSNPKKATPGAIIAALGSPTDCTTAAIRAFLEEFLSDPRVVDLPRWAWKPILHSMVLPRRPSRILEQYQYIWLPGGSPLRVHTEAQRRELAALLPGVDVRIAYQYGGPSIAEVAADLGRTCSDVVVLTTYPQRARATTGSVSDRVEAARTTAFTEGLTPPRLAPEWPTLPAYIDWYADRIAQEWQEHQTDTLVFSWHGVPERPAHDPADYRAQCHSTALAIVDALKRRGLVLPWVETFQSKFGPGRWLQPATIEELPRLAREGVRSVLVANPGFMADCLETVYEMDVLNAEAFREAGGLQFHRISPPDAASAARMLAAVYAAAVE